MNSKREDALFYDFDAVLKDIDNLINNQQHFIISSFTLYDLEEYNDIMEKLQQNKSLWTDWYCPVETTNKKLAEVFCACDYEEKVRPDETVFVTGSYASYLIANRYFGEDSIKYIKK